MTARDSRLAIEGRRVAVFGPTGSGKSTLAREIGARLGLRVIELDAIFHRPDWQPTPEDEFRATVADLLAAHDAWVTDGNYRGVRDLILPRAETVVWLQLPFLPVYRRLFWRTVRRMWTRELLWGTNRESFRLSFLSRDSILLWGITHWRAHRRTIAASLRDTPHNARVLVLRSDADVRALLASLPRPAVRP